MRNHIRQIVVERNKLTELIAPPTPQRGKKILSYFSHRAKCEGRNLLLNEGNPSLILLPGVSLKVSDTYIHLCVYPPLKTVSLASAWFARPWEFVKLLLQICNSSHSYTHSRFIPEFFGSSPVSPLLLELGEDCNAFLPVGVFSVRIFRKVHKLLLLARLTWINLARNLQVIFNYKKDTTNTGVSLI